MAYNLFTKTKAKDEASENEEKNKKISESFITLAQIT